MHQDTRNCWRIASGGHLNPILEGFADSVHRGGLPTRLYRYRPIPENLTERLEQEVIRGEVWLSPLARLNDLEEGAVDVRLRGLDQDLIAFLAQDAKADVAEIERRVQLVCAADGVLPDAKERSLLEAISRLTHVACFTTNPVEALMWSHYAIRGTDRKPHAGLCIEYAVDESARWTGIQPVAYTDLRPRIDYLAARRDPTLMRHALLTKSSPWRYEKEWRIVAFSDEVAGAFGAKVLAAPSGAVSSIILGLAVDPHVEAVVRHITRGAKHSIQLQRIVRSRDHYGLSIVEVE